MASFTRAYTASDPVCLVCGWCRISSRHKLTIYSMDAHAGHSTCTESTKNTQNILGSVDLPAFNASDCMTEAGLVVSAAWSPCGTYIAAARDDDYIDLYDHRFLRSTPVTRMRHKTLWYELKQRPARNLEGRDSGCCFLPEKHPRNGVTALQWVQGAGYFGGLGLITGGSDGA